MNGRFSEQMTHWSFLIVVMWRSQADVVLQESQTRSCESRWMCVALEKHNFSNKLLHPDCERWKTHARHSLFFRLEPLSRSRVVSRRPVSLYASENSQGRCRLPWFCCHGETVNMYSADRRVYACVYLCVNVCVFKRQQQTWRTIKLKVEKTENRHSVFVHLLLEEIVRWIIGNWTMAAISFTVWSLEMKLG